MLDTYSKVEFLPEICRKALFGKLPPNIQDYGGFLIPLAIGNVNFDKALFHVATHINVMPYNVYRRLGLGRLSPSTNSLRFADGSIKEALGSMEGVVVKVKDLHFPIEFTVFDCEEDGEIPILLGRSFLKSGGGWIDAKEWTLILKVEDKEVILDPYNEQNLPSIEQPCGENEMEEVAIDDSIELSHSNGPESCESQFLITEPEKLEKPEVDECSEEIERDLLIPFIIIAEPPPMEFEEMLSMPEKLKKPEVDECSKEIERDLLIPFIIIAEPPPMKFEEMLTHLRYNKEYWEVSFDMKTAKALRSCHTVQLKRFHLNAMEKNASKFKEPQLFAKGDLEHFKTSAISPNFI